MENRPGTKQLRSAMALVPAGVVLFLIGLWASYADSSAVGLIGGLAGLCGIVLLVWGLLSLFRGIWKRVA